MKLKITPSLLWPIVVLILALAAFILKPWQTTNQEIISVSSEGKTQAVPNVAKISAAIESKNPNFDMAREENQKKVSELITSLKSLGIEEKDIKTEYISAGPGYEIQTFPAPDRPTTNQLTTTLEITIRNFDNSDEVMQALTQNGATNLYGPNLTVSDDKLEEAKVKAREDAVENAKKKATQLAEASGRKVGKVVKIQEQGDFGYPVPMMARTEADLKSQASNIQPGQTDVTINLQVDFSIK